TLPHTAAEPVPPSPTSSSSDETMAIYSPRRRLDALDLYRDLAAEAKRGLFMTFAFGMNERFVKVYDQEDDVLRFALMEKKGNGKTFKKQAEEVDRIRRLRNVVVSVGHRVEI